MKQQGVKQMIYRVYEIWMSGVCIGKNQLHILEAWRISDSPIMLQKYEVSMPSFWKLGKLMHIPLFFKKIITLW